MRRKYNLTKPRTLTHPQNKVKPFEERKVQMFFSVKGKYYIEAQKAINNFINQNNWK